MPTYDFVCKKCKQVYEIAFRMDDDEGRKSVRCLKCKAPLRRKFGTPAMIVKGTANQVLNNLSANQTIIDHDGQPIRLNFIDHGEASQLAPGSIGQHMPGARMDEKTGRMVVDVKSNIPDPLGHIDRMKKRGRVDKSVHQIKQPYKTRK